MLSRVGILRIPKIPKSLRTYTSKGTASWSDELEITNIFEPIFDYLNMRIQTSVEGEPLAKRVARLEATVDKLRKEKMCQKLVSQADLVYAKHKKSLEKDHFGKIVAIDIDSQKVVGIGTSILEAYKKAKEKTSKDRFTYRRVGFPFVHRI